jgi:two-component system NarL family sensor kinase
VALSRVQLSRVVTIGRLVRDRGELLTELVSLEARQRAELAERLHDGALQYLLAARQDVDDARDLGDPAAFDRLEQAIRESSQMLRTTVSELHPAVLAQAGLAHALQDLATATATRSRLTVDLELDEWPDRPTAADTLMFNAAKEILTNVVKHAHAQHVAINLEMRDGTALLTVADDGRGVTEGVLDSKLADGHIGLASQRARVAAAGGRLTVEPAHPCGTLVTVSLPVRVPALERARP